MLDQPINEISQDRRSRRRYSLDLELQFKVIDRYQGYYAGAGKTLNLSSGGVAFLSDQALHPGTFVELSINWPILLNQTCPLKLVLSGTVVRSKDKETAIKMDRYEFRTQGAKNGQSLREAVIEKFEGPRA